MIVALRSRSAADLAFGLLALGSVALTPVVQLLWTITVDEVGLDRTLPDAAFTVGFPALTLALVPATAAAVRYDRRRAAVVGLVVAVAVAAVATRTVEFFALCGRGC